MRLLRGWVRMHGLQSDLSAMCRRTVPARFGAIAAEDLRGAGISKIIR